MKRSGQWLFMLWVAAALLYPQAATAVSLTHNQASQLNSGQVQALPLLADCSFKETSKVEAKLSTTPDNSDQFEGENTLLVSQPVASARSPHAATPVQPIIEEARGLLPFVCGPPVQS
ncbi:MAG: hypothetical protein ACAH89_01310 [Rariglobus sp.]|nr:hypothetical protein [Rariglobus sp.]